MPGRWGAGPGGSGCTDRSWPQAWLGQACAPACWGHPVLTKRTSPNRQWCCLVPGRKPQGKNGSRGSTGSPRTPLQGSPVRGGHQPQGQVLAASPHLLDPRGHGSHRLWSAARVSVFQIHLHFSLVPWSHELTNWIKNPTFLCASRVISVTEGAVRDGRRGEPGSQCAPHSRHLRVDLRGLSAPSPGFSSFNALDHPCPGLGRAGAGAQWRRCRPLHWGCLLQPGALRPGQTPDSRNSPPRRGQPSCAALRNGSVGDGPLCLLSF